MQRAAYFAERGIRLAVVELPSEWLEKAEVFLREAKRHLDEGVYWLSCFEAQQAAELYLKALYVALTGLHPFTHDLSELLESLRPLGLNPPDDLVIIADALTPHYIFYENPEKSPVTYTKSLARRCISYADQIIEWVKQVSEEQGRLGGK